MENPLLVELKSVNKSYNSLKVLDNINLRTITQEEYREITNKKRELLGFYEVQLLPDEPSSLPAYNSEIEVFIRDAMMPVYKHTKPKQEEINKANSGISSFSALGEIEPVSFAVYSQNGIQDLKVEVSDLINPNSEIITKEDISIQQVVYDEKRLSHYYPSGGVYTRAYALVPDRLEDFSTFDVEAGTSERIWLKIRVPENIQGGIYNGSIVIKQNTQIKKTISIELNVLPIKLNLSESINPVYSDPFSKVYSSNINEVFKMYRETGFDPFISVLITEPLTENRIIVDYNTTKFEHNLDRMIRERFLKKTAFVESLGAWPAVYKAVFNREYSPHNPATFYDDLSNQTFVDALGLAIRKYQEIADNNNLTFIYSSIDEPANSVERMIIADRIFTILKSNSASTTVTYTDKSENEWDLSEDPEGYVVPGGILPGLKNLVDYKVWNPTHQGGGYYRNYYDYGYYTTTTSYLRNPIYNRFLHGLLAFRTDAKAVSAYAMGAYVNDPFNDFDAWPDYVHPFTYPDFIFAYPSWDGELVYTMNSEGIREGIKDAKYIATLKELIKNNPNTTADEAQAYLDSIKDKINPDYWTAYPGKTNQFGYAQFILRDLSETGNSEDFEAFTSIRANISDYIIKLNQEAKTTSTTTETKTLNPFTKILNWIKSLLTTKTGHAITGNVVKRKAVLNNSFL